MFFPLRYSLTKAVLNLLSHTLHLPTSECNRGQGEQIRLSSRRCREREGEDSRVHGRASCLFQRDEERALPGYGGTLPEDCRTRNCPGRNPGTIQQGAKKPQQQVTTKEAGLPGEEFGAAHKRTKA